MIRLLSPIALQSQIFMTIKCFRAIMFSLISNFQDTFGIHNSDLKEGLVSLMLCTLSFMFEF